MKKYQVFPFLGKIIAFPIVFLWAMLVHFISPKLLKYWNPFPIEVINMGKRYPDLYETESAAHGYVTVHQSENGQGEQFWFRVDHPEKLRNVSRKSLRRIVMAYERRNIKIIAISIYCPDTGYYSHCAVKTHPAHRPCFAYTETKWN